MTTYYIEYNNQYGDFCTNTVESNSTDADESLIKALLYNKYGSVANKYEIIDFKDADTMTYYSILVDNGYNSFYVDCDGKCSDEEYEFYDRREAERVAEEYKANNKEDDVEIVRNFVNPDGDYSSEYETAEA